MCIRDSHTAVPETGNQYVASIPEMEEMPITKEVEHYLYAGMAVQVGYCNGNGSLLNAFEYHKCSEVSVGPTDMVFMMYKVEDLSAEGTVDSKDVVAFYCPAGVAVEKMCIRDSMWIAAFGYCVLIF